MKLRKSDRHQRIISKLRKDITVRISDLAKQFGVTTETIRRDLKELDRRGLLNRTYGGAAGSLTREPAIRLRELIRVEERNRIAAKALRLVVPGDVLMIDSGSTTVHFARSLALEDMELNVLTNCVLVASLLTENAKIRVILCPGEFSNRENSVFGLETHHFLNRFHANKAFIGAAGINPQGLTETHSDASWVKRKMIERSDRTVLLIDSSKFNVNRMERVCTLDQINEIVVDSPPDADLTDALIAAAVSVHLAAPNQINVETTKNKV